MPPHPIRRTRSARLAGVCAIAFVAWASPACGPNDPAARNLLLITVDTLRADRLGAWGYERPTSPNLDALAAESVRFSRAYAHSPWTLPSLSSLMTSRYAASHGVTRYDSRLGEGFETLAERLSASGWKTASVVSHTYLARKFGLVQGFAHYDDDLVQDVVRSHLAVSSPEVTRRGLEWLTAIAGDRTPWLLWLHYFDPHAVYRPHPDLDRSFGRRPSDLYDGEIAFTDLALGRLLAGLSNLGLADDTVVALTSDHGEEFGDHGGERHGRTLYEEVIHVPLLIRAPGFAPRRVDRRVGMVDLLPTLLELLGVPAAQNLEGRSLVPAMRGADVAERPVLLEARLHGSREGLIEGPWKLLRESGSGAIELYDLEADPRERRDRSADEPERVRALSQRLDSMLEAAQRQAAPTGRVELSAEEVEGLTNLGYLDEPQSRQDP